MTTLILGFGNPDRGDDALGPIATAQLGGAHANPLTIDLAGVTTLICLDAAAPNGTPGRIHEFDASAAQLPAALEAVSSHGFGLAAALELARALGELPPRVLVFAVEGVCFDHGAPLSPAVAAALPELQRRVRAVPGA
ncbi:hydrogenase maturation protease [Acidocella aromatica]|uniref:Hydrogenase maturation protease n=1 Tax=Acidocella aromatica TaxID=1303579 RepID=A0A840VDZ4_9PROT|nr:hydrogenase maturation protease [Acidocella aromatica]MBB5373097.1 hydrogenase maturation protease [Acidocella aromatica]